MNLTVLLFLVLATLISPPFFPTGATLYAMLFGVVAFSGTGNHEVSENIRTKALTFGETTISLPLRMLLRRMLEKDILLRITLNEILDDPWVSGEGIWQVCVLVFARISFLIILRFFTLQRT